MRTIAPGKARNLPQATKPSATSQTTSAGSSRPRNTIRGSHDVRERRLFVRRGPLNQAQILTSLGHKSKTSRKARADVESAQPSG